MSPSPADAPENPSRKSTEQQLNRACEACRMSKVRCLANPVAGSSQCQRCAKAGRQCVFAPPAKRRQRKRTDVRVAELEKEVKQLHSLMQTNPTVGTSLAEASLAEISRDGTSEHDSLDEEETEDTQSPELDSPAYGKNQEGTYYPRVDHRTTSWSVIPPQDSAQLGGDVAKIEHDIVDRGIITMEQAQDLLDTYRMHLVHHVPGVVIPNRWTAGHLRSRKPALFLAVMAAASNSSGSTLSNKLHDEVIQLYARAIIIDAEKSLQYIQALFVTIGYNNPPKSPAQLQVYMFCNIAASMALELGLASKPRGREQLPKRAIKVLQRISSAEELLEHVRTILALYTLTAGFSMRLRRPVILLFNSWMEECQLILQKSRSLEDRRLLAWLGLQRIADEACSALGLDDASTSFTLSELRLKTTLKIFDRRMEDWKKSIPEEVMTYTMMVEYHMNIVSMWEFAMDGGRFNAPDFRNRQFTLPALDDETSVQPESFLSRTALQITATMTCVNAAQSVLDNFLSISIESLQNCPSVTFVRVVFALITLLKMDYAVGTDPEGLGTILDPKTLKVETYLEDVASWAEQGIGEQGCRVPAHWAMVIRKKLKGWHDEHMNWRREGGHLRRMKAKRDVVVPQDAPPTFTHARVDPTPPQPTTVLPTRSSAPFSQPSTTTHQQVQPVSDPQGQQNPLPTTFGIPQQPLPAFNLNADYTWPASDLNSLSSVPTTLPAADPATFDQEMTDFDFSTAFQNGDLYLWNDLGENYGGWIPHAQSDTMLYDVMQFGGTMAM